MNEISRRRFLTVAGLGLSAAVLEACGAVNPTATAVPKPAEVAKPVEKPVEQPKPVEAPKPAAAPKPTEVLPTVTVPAKPEATGTVPPVKPTETVVSGRVATAQAMDKAETATAVASPSNSEITALKTQVADLQKKLEVTRVPGNAKLEKPNFVEDVSHGAWTIKGTSRLKENQIVADWLKKLKDPTPDKGKYYPNVQGDYPLSEFDVKAGVEYGVANAPFSEHPKGAEFIVPAWHYRLFTGPYKFMGEDHLSGDKQNGQMLLVINVMKESVTFADPDQEFRNGFTVAGRYWDGDKLDQGTWALTNHVVANMTNRPTNSRMGEVLNAGTPGNAGANCGIPEGCKAVDVNVIIVAGDAVIAQAKAVVK